MVSRLINFEGWRKLMLVFLFWLSSRVELGRGCLELRERFSEYIMTNFLVTER